MPKKRRRLNKDMENNIEKARKTVELITAKINDIEDEEIQVEYREAFNPIVIEATTVGTYYKDYGFSEESEAMISRFNDYLNKFLSEYEL